MTGVVDGKISVTGYDSEDNAREVLIDVSGGGVRVSPDPTPSQYTGDITFTIAGVAFPLADETSRVTLTNDDIANFGRFAYGSSEADAIANAASGKKLYPRTAENANTSTLTRRRPKNKTHGAIVANTASIIVDVQQEI